jgi:hypothetical protein
MADLVSGNGSIRRRHDAARFAFAQGQTPRAAAASSVDRRFPVFAVSPFARDRKGAEVRFFLLKQIVRCKSLGRKE